MVLQIDERLFDLLFCFWRRHAESVQHHRRHRLDVCQIAPARNNPPHRFDLRTLLLKGTASPVLEDVAWRAPDAIAGRLRVPGRDEDTHGLHSES